jgi:hypothetical protein
MMFRETVSVYCENRTELTDTLCGQNEVCTNSFRTSQETYYFSATKPNRLMLFRKTVAVYSENHTKHRYTLWAECSVYKFSRTSNKTHYVSATKPKWLMLFKDIIAI